MINNDFMALMVEYAMTDGMFVDNSTRAIK